MKKKLEEKKKFNKSIDDVKKGKAKSADVLDDAKAKRESNRNKNTKAKFDNKT